MSSFDAKTDTARTSLTRSLNDVLEYLDVNSSSPLNNKQKKGGVAIKPNCDQTQIDSKQLLLDHVTRALFKFGNSPTSNAHYV